MNDVVQKALDGLAQSRYCPRCGKPIESTVGRLLSHERECDGLANLAVVKNALLESLARGRPRPALPPPSSPRGRPVGRPAAQPENRVYRPGPSSGPQCSHG